MILLTAAALIFFAITLNWGRIAQTKALVTIAADQAASLLASDAASYGEMQKQTYLQNTNQISSLNGIIMAIIAVVVAIICLVITITTAGAGSGIWVVLAIVLAAAAVVMAVVNLVLQICVVQPGITKLWNSMQKDQPIQQQFYEGGVSTALQSSITDQTLITDYFDMNTNGVFGLNWANGFPNDTVPRFAFYYTDRLRMLNSADTTIDSSQAQFFLNQLGEFVNGSTCVQNSMDHLTYPGIPLNPQCSTDCPNTSWGLIGTSGYCASGSACTVGHGTCTNGAACTENGIACADGSRCSTCADGSNCQEWGHCGNGTQCKIGATCADGSQCSAVDPNCMMAMPNMFQLSAACSAGSNPGDSTYSAYCDPCCQPFSEPNPEYNSSGQSSQQHKYKLLRPSSCPAPTSATGCSDPQSAACTCNITPTATGCIPSNCTNTSYNPYGSTNPYIYDSTYQNYTSTTAFLAQYGRDQQKGPFSTNISPKGSSSNGVYFPNGVFPFFW